MHKLSELLTLWNGSNINYCIWKGAAKFPLVLQGKEDLDVLIDIESIDEAKRLLRSCDFIEAVNCNEKNDFGTFDYLYLTNEMKWIHVHLHLYILFGNSVVRDYYLPLEQDVLKDKIFDENIKCQIINPYDDIALSLIRYTVRKKIIVGYMNLESDLSDLKKNFADEKIELLGDRNGVYIKSIISTLSNLKNTKQHDLINIRRDVLKSITPYRDSLNLKYFINYIFILIKLIWKKIMKRKGQKTLANRGLVVAFVGIDGSGKSSAIERVNKKISEHFDVQTISLGSGVSGASWYRKLAFKVFGTKAKFKSHVKNRSSKNAVKKYPWYYTLWLMICLYDKKNAVLKGVQAARSGSIVLCDRWLQTEIENFTDSPRINKKSAITYLTKKLYNLEQEVFSLTKVHKPDLIFRFDVSPENSVLRKPNDLTLEQAIHASQKIKDIVWGGVKVISIDANDSIENVDGSLSEAINKVIYCKN